MPFFQNSTNTLICSFELLYFNSIDSNELVPAPISALVKSSKSTIEIPGSFAFIRDASTRAPVASKASVMINVK